MNDENTTVLLGGLTALAAYLLTRPGASAPSLSELTPDVPNLVPESVRDAYVNATTGSYAIAEPDGPTNVEDEEGIFAPVHEAETVGGYDPTENQASDEHDYTAPTYDSPASADAVEDVSRQVDGGESEQEFTDEWASHMPDLSTETVDFSDGVETIDSPTEPVEDSVNDLDGDMWSNL